MPTISTLTVDVVTNTSRFSTGLRVATAGLAALASGAVYTFRQFEESQNVLQQTEAVLESTGGASDRSAAQIANMADELSTMSGIDDEVIQRGENMLLTFKNIEGQRFDQATQSMVDMAAGMAAASGGSVDLKGASIQLGKALNDPIAGMSSLTRVGVQFTEQQQNQITRLVESGNLYRAQGIILKEVNSQFAGSAAANATASAKMSVALGNLAESVGAIVAPALTFLAQKVQALAEWFTGLSPGVRQALIAIGSTAAVVAPVIIVAGKLVTAIRSIVVVFRILTIALSTNPYVLLIAATVAIAVLIIKNWDKIKESLLRAWETLKSAAAAAWNAIKNTAESVWNAIASFFRRFWPLILTIFTGGLSLVVGVVVKNWDAIKEGTSNAWNAVLSFLKSIPGKIRDFFVGAATWLYETGRDIILGLINGIGSMVSAIIGKIQDVVGGAIDAAKNLLGIGSPSKVFEDIGVNMMKGLDKGLKRGHPGVEMTLRGIGQMSTVESMGLGGVRSDIVLNVNGETLARVTRDELVKLGRRNGSTGL